jgi:glycosyltransferase involved in cell wall biosynthesis
MTPLEQAQKDLPKMFKAPSKEEPFVVINYPSDKNGCGYYRSIIPFSYLMSKCNMDSPFMFGFNFDVSFIQRANWIRFQRQVTEAQKAIFSEFRNLIKKYNFKTKLTYDIDDLVHEIEDCNILAYQYYTETRKKNLIDLFNLSDLVTFSTQFLKDYYEERHGIKHSRVIPNFLPKFLWGQCGKRDKYNKGKNGKLRILWTGSSSHIGKGGDLEFLLPLIEKTTDEFEWVFLGTCPAQLLGKVEFHDWEEFFMYPQHLDAVDADVGIVPVKDHIFNYAKSDLKLLEYSAVGLPSLCSSIGGGIGPYDLVKDALVVENHLDAWYGALKQLHKDQDMRKKYLEIGRNELNKRWLENPENYGLYTKLYKS